MFRDELRIKVKAGNGGPGASTFRREKFVPKGGPDGGTGGKGGDVILVSDANFNTLYHLFKKPHFNAENGERGMGNNRTGRNGKHLLFGHPR